MFEVSYHQLLLFSLLSSDDSEEFNWNGFVLLFDLGLLGGFISFFFIMSIGLDFGVNFKVNFSLLTELFSLSDASSSDASSSDTDEDSHDEWGVIDVNKSLASRGLVLRTEDSNPNSPSWGLTSNSSSSSFTTLSISLSEIDCPSF